MLKRLIPVLLLDKKQRLIKTEAFGRRTYIGDPFNIVRLFNEMQIDELCILDIDAQTYPCGPNYDFISKFASECFMPLAYGGGINSVEQADTLNGLGIEKFVIGSQALNSSLVSSLVNKFGSQSIIACIDYEGNRVLSPPCQLDVMTCLKHLEDCGVGEILLQSVERDGSRKGYDLGLIKTASDALSIPLIALGGAGTYGHLKSALESGASAAASGSVFSFIGDLRAVLVNYPSYSQRSEISGDEE